MTSPNSANALNSPSLNIDSRQVWPNIVAGTPKPCSTCSTSVYAGRPAVLSSTVSMLSV